MRITPRAWKIICSLFLILFLNLTIYHAVRTFGLISMDDKQYVLYNNHVRQGFTVRDVQWAFSTFHAAFWIPLTWVSYMFDTQFLGPGPASHHSTNLFLHLANGVILFLFLLRMTDAPVRSALAALLFAVHPLRVESVAWVTERKDVLSAFFLLLALEAYLLFLRRRSRGWYLTLLLLFVLGSMAKPMLVTLPFVLLLLDFWPLARLTPPGVQRSDLLRIVGEKVPLFILSAIFSFVAYRAAVGHGTLRLTTIYPFRIRAANAVLSYGGYLRKTFWPKDLAVFYPHPGLGIPVSSVVWTALFLALLTSLALFLWRKHPFLLTGWFWYLGTLIPVIGIVQAGSQSMADRFSYIPSIGLSLAVCWGAAAAFPRRGWHSTVPAVIGAGAVFALTAASVRQLDYWRDPVSLFRHSLALTSDNCLTRQNLGTHFLEQGNADEAVAHLKIATMLCPQVGSVRNDLGTAFLRKGMLTEAIEEHRQAIRCEENSSLFHGNLGIDLMMAGRSAEAIEAFGRALSLDPSDPFNHENLGDALLSAGKPAEAVEHIEEALRLNPRSARARRAKGMILEIQGRFSEAAACYRQALDLNPDDGEIRKLLDEVQRKIGRPNTPL